MGVSGGEEVVLLECVHVVLLRCRLSWMMHDLVELRIRRVLLLLVLLLRLPRHLPFLFVGELVAHLSESLKRIYMSSILSILEKRAHQGYATFKLSIGIRHQYHEFGAGREH